MIKLDIFKFVVGFAVVIICVLTAYACIDIAAKADEQEEKMIENLRKEKEKCDKEDM